jgi:hypothetical protein
MSNPHEPREAFVTQLEQRVRSDFQRRSRVAPAPGWLLQSKARLVLAAVALVVVSMAIGGGVVAAAYEAERSAQRNMLVETLEQRAELARRRLALATQQLREEEQRVAVGIGDHARSREARLKVAEAEAEVKLVEIDLDEVRATGREPMTTVSAPLVGGRDLVGQRWRAERSVRAVALEMATEDVRAARTRVEVGLANLTEVEAATGRMFEVESAVHLIGQKFEIRQAFLTGHLSAAVADLRVLAAETEQQRTVLGRRLEAARREMQELKIRHGIGAAGSLELAEAEVRLHELQLAMSKTDYELALIRTRLAK